MEMVLIIAGAFDWVVPGIWVWLEMRRLDKWI
jgi:hypothetical protein